MVPTAPVSAHVMQSRAAHYGISVASTLLALALGGLLARLAGTHTQLPFLAAVAVSTWYGGLGPGAVATVGSWLLNDYFFLGPGSPLLADTLRDAVRGALFLGSAVLVLVLGSALRAARSRADAEAQEERRQAAALREREREFQSLLADAQRSEARFRRVVEDAPDGIVITDQHGRIVLANSQAHKLFAYGVDELLGKVVEDLIPAPVRQTHMAHRHAYRAGPHPRPMGAGLALRGLRKDGSEVPVEISLSPLEAEEGLLVMAAIRDIGDRQKAETQIRTLNQDLEHRLADLAALNRELEAFSYSVSHDLRAPLRSIDGFSQALLEDYADRLDETGRDYLTRVRAATQRMGDLIDDLLTLSRVTRREMRREPVDLSQLAKTILAQLHHAEPGRAVECVVADGCRAHGDPQLLRVALENLLGNAWKFTGRQSTPRIEFGVVAGTPPTYFVRDNGIGFDMAYSQKLFGAFQRLHLASEFPGTGIGLATVHRIITRHGGRVWADAAPGAGATFHFTLSSEGAR